MANYIHKELRAILIFHLILACTPVFSQVPSHTVDADERISDFSEKQHEYSLKTGTNELGIWGGGSFDSPTIIGTAEDRRFLIFGLRYGRILGGNRQIAIQYTADVVPAAVVFQPEFARDFNRRPDSSIYGAGISPLGFKAIFNRNGKVKPFASTSGGFLYFKRPVPEDIDDATRFNFTFDFGGGVQIFTRNRRAVTIGYKFHHISNGYRSNVNPGLDGNVFYVGYSIFR